MTFPLTAASRISLGWLARPYSRRMPLNSAVPTAFSNPRMRASRSSPEPTAEPLDFAVWACNAFVPFSYVRSAILTDERFLHFQLRQDSIGHARSCLSQCHLSRSLAPKGNTGKRCYPLE